MKNLLNFLNTSAGLLILGFLLTTGVGALLNQAVQNEKSQNEREFEMYRMRLEEAKALQKQLLEQSKTRIFYLEQILGKLEDQEPSGEIEKYWKDNYTIVKDNWNKDLGNFHAQMRVLFTGNLPRRLSENADEKLSSPNFLR